MTLAVYALATIGLFGFRVLPHFSTSYIGLGDSRLSPGFTDPSAYMWSFVWWPHALLGGIDPSFTHLVWAPSGYSLTWGQLAPGAGLLAWPITAIAGPVAAYNVWMILAPTLAAWTAYLLARHISRSFWPSLVAGYVFGFSSYELTQMTVHLNLSSIFPIPLAVLLVLRHVEGLLPTRRFVVLLALILVLEFSFSPELLLTTLVFGTLTMLMALALTAGEMRRRIMRAGALVAVASGLAAALVSPYLAVSLARGMPHNLASGLYSTDGLNLILPTAIHRFGSIPFSPITTQFRAGLDEEGAYFGPLLLVVLWYTIAGLRGSSHRLLLAIFSLVVVCSLGPVLLIGGTSTISLPWKLASHVPLLRDALPGRFIVYAWLAVAVIVALWLSTAGRRALLKWCVVLVSLVLLLPNTRLPLWKHRVDTPSFFTTTAYRQFLSPGENVLVIPFGKNGFSELWQAETGLWFGMPEGYLSYYMPPGFQRCHMIRAFLNGAPIRNFEQRLRAFLAASDVGAIIVKQGTPGPWESMFSVLGVQPVAVGGVILYRVPPSPSPALYGPNCS